MVDMPRRTLAARGVRHPMRPAATPLGAGVENPGPASFPGGKPTWRREIDEHVLPAVVGEQLAGEPAV